MKNNIINLVSAIILSISLIFSAVYLGDTISKCSINNSDKDSEASDTLLLNTDQAAEYIGISADTLVSIIKKEKIEKQDLSVYETYMFIPYLELDDAIYFTKSELQKWAEYNTKNH